MYTIITIIILWRTDVKKNDYSKFILAAIVFIIIEFIQIIFKIGTPSARTLGWLHFIIIIIIRYYPFGFEVSTSRTKQYPYVTPRITTTSLYERCALVYLFIRTSNIPNGLLKSFENVIIFFFSRVQAFRNNKHFRDVYTLYCIILLWDTDDL